MAISVMRVLTPSLVKSAMIFQSSLKSERWNLKVLVFLTK